MTENQKNYFQTNVQSVLSSRDLELFEFCKMSGVTMDPQVFRVLVELLRLDVSPSALFDILHTMASQYSHSSLISKKNTHNKSGDKKKPPVAAKPKKIKVENINYAC